MFIDQDVCLAAKGLKVVTRLNLSEYEVDELKKVLQKVKTSSIADKQFLSEVVEVLESFD